MIGHKAAARRVGLLLDPWIVRKLDVESWNMFEDTVNWCVEQIVDRQSTDGD